MKHSPIAQGLLDFLTSISGSYTLSGQHNYITTPDKYTDLVEQLTGKRPLVWGSDFSFKADVTEHGKYYHCGPLNVSDPGLPPAMLDVTPEQMRDELVERAIANHRRGHIITLMWHCCLPQFGDCGPYESIWTMEKRPDRATWAEITTPGTKLHGQWLTQVDRIAGYLARLRDAGVPVLWRPYHEMNGVWFWWCNHKGSEGFARLWRNLHERFTRHHRLDNLVWVWNTNAPRDRPGDEAFAYADFYPGAGTVDVLAADVYRRDYKQSHHDDLAALAKGKPIALGEVGELPDSVILEQQPRWAWFMPWGCLVTRSNKPEQVKQLYACERVLSLGDVRRSSAGQYSVES
jgi:mannan endo-1,4-beta-mannosidase